MESLYGLVTKRRSIRAFKQREVSLNVIKKAINSARLAPSAANLQFLEYLVIRDKPLRDKVFLYTSWAGYVKPKRIPKTDQKPTLYVAILVNKNKTNMADIRDVGASAQNMILTFLENNIGTCWLGAIDKKSLVKLLKIPANYELDSMIAAGYPDEVPKLEADAKNIKYWVDDKNRLHVPKRPLKDIMYFNKIK